MIVTRCYNRAIAREIIQIIFKIIININQLLIIISKFDQFPARKAVIIAAFEL